MVVDAPASGWTEWRNRAGQTLDAVKRQPAETEAG